MRIKTTIQITQVTTLTKDVVGVYFFDTKDKFPYLWKTTSWKSGSNITHSIKGDQYNVSFRIVTESIAISDYGKIPFTVTNLRVLKTK